MTSGVVLRGATVEPAAVAPLQPVHGRTPVEPATSGAVCCTAERRDAGGCDTVVEALSDRKTNHVTPTRTLPRISTSGPHVLPQPLGANQQRQ